MDLRLYNNLANICDRCVVEQLMLDPRYVLQKFPTLNWDMVLIVYRQQYQRHIRRTSHVHRRSAKKYVRLYEEGQRIMHIAQYVNFSPYLLARLLIEHLIPCSKKSVTKYIKNLNSIVDTRLRLEVSECIEMDQFCSPYCDRVRRTLGLEYEYILQQSIKNAGLPFDSEDTLRQVGWSKTPDVKLQCPISVPFNGKSYIVNWIDSKAMFGDPHTHDSENAKQLQGYLNRFGTGMVIYWFGYVKSLNSNPDILVLDRFPEKFMSLVREGDSLEGRIAALNAKAIKV